MKKILIFTVGVLLSLSPWLQAQQAGSGRYDQQIQQEVMKALQSNNKWSHVTASTDDAIVTLSGTTNLLIDKMDARNKVAHLPHVDGVRNHIQVASEVSDQELQKKLADELRYDRFGFGMVFNALGLQVHDGVVTVSGDVHDYPSRDSALGIIETTPGVKDVIDNINVLPVSPMDDQIRLAVARAIYSDPALMPYANDPERPIRIVVNNGHVTLYGVVNSQMDKQIAETRARSVPNVFSVDDKLIVAGQGNK